MHFNWKIFLLLMFIFFVSFNVSCAANLNQTILTDNSSQLHDSQSDVGDDLSVKFVDGEHILRDGVTARIHIKNNGNVDLEGVFITIDYDSRISFSSFECVKENYSYKNISGVKKTHVDYEYMSYVWKLTKKDNKLFFSMTRPLKVFESMDLYLFFDGPGKFNIPFNLSLVAGFNNTIVCNDTCFRYQKYYGINVPWVPPRPNDWDIIHEVPNKYESSSKKDIHSHSDKHASGNPIFLLLLNSLIVCVLFKRRF